MAAALLVASLAAGRRASVHTVREAPRDSGRLTEEPPPPSSALRSLESRLDGLCERIEDLERVAPKEFEVFHYNVLARQYGSNMQPWFLYGAGVSDAERRQMLERFYAAGPDGQKQAADKGWPGWAEGVLSKERRASIEAYHEASFSWERRRERLWDVVRGANADVVTLAECDCFDTFWKPKFDSAAYGVVWRKRPRPSSPDGCAIAWRNSTFELLGVGGFDFGSSLDRLPDRTCLFALLRWRRDPNQRLLVATAHLARMATSVAESADQLLARGFQYGVLFRELLQFAASHQAEDVPVVLTGDLNAKDCDELAGIARALVRLLSSPTHPLLWSIMDAPTPPTTVTEERALRIDYLLYQSAALTLVGVTQLPRLTSPIPDSQHPSDHLPIAARLVVRPRWQRVEEDARQWCACISGTNSVRPLSGEALRDAFSYFDKDGSSRVSLIQLETGLQTLGFPGLNVKQVRKALAAAGCDGLPSIQLSDECAYMHRDPLENSLSPRRRELMDDGSWEMSQDQFVHAYVYFMSKHDSAAARQLQKAFSAFDFSGDGSVSHAELRTVLERMATAPIAEDRIGQLLRELDPENTGTITLDEFSRWMAHTYASYLERPSLVPDSVLKIQQLKTEMGTSTTHGRSNLWFRC